MGGHHQQSLLYFPQQNSYRLLSIGFVELHHLHGNGVGNPKLHYHLRTVVLGIEVIESAANESHLDVVFLHSPQGKYADSRFQG